MTDAGGGGGRPGGWAGMDPRWRGVATDWVELPGASVRLLRHDGPAAGTPRLLVHGLGGSATNWLDVIGPLAQRGPVAAVDLPGFGLTRPPAPRAARMGAQARFLTALCDRLGWDRVVVHASSMGGLVAVLAAARSPRLVAGLVLAAPALPVPLGHLPAVPVATYLRLAALWTAGLGPGATAAAWRRLSPERLQQTALSVYAHPERLRDSVREVMLANYRDSRRLAWRPPSFAIAARSLVAHLFGRRAVGRAVAAIPTPALVVRGREDPVVPAAVVDGLTDRRPDWAAVRLDDVGHVAMMEAPDAYAAATAGWDGASPRAEASSSG